MNIRTHRTATVLSLIVAAASLAACGAAHSPGVGQADTTDRFVAAATAGALEEIVVTASRLPAETVSNATLEEIVVTASRLRADDGEAGHDLGEIVVQATRLPADDTVGASDTRVAALLD